MNKRRRTPSIVSRNADDDESDSQSTGIMETSRKKRKLNPIDSMQTLYDTIRNFKKEDGSLLCDAFIRLPKRRQEPGYHDVVTNPIDLIKIQNKLKTDEYEDVDDLQADVELLVNNAKSFYKRSSQEYKDASDLWELFLQTRSRIFDLSDDAGDNKTKLILKVGKIVKKEPFDLEESSTESWTTNNEDELNLCEDLFSAVITAADADRPLYPVFQLLPSRKRYPKYYTVIENPIDLRTIARKIQDGKYASLGELEKDLLLMTKNACTFNEPGSQIYKDAKMLKKIISSKKIEIEHSKGAVEKKSERIRNKRLRGPSQSLSAVTAALESENEESDSDDDQQPVEEVVEEVQEDPENPQWQLFNSVRMYTNAQGACLSEPFLKLPSKRYYPNYYKEIKNPMSFFLIRKKLCNGHYGTVSEVAGDLNILFENTKTFHRPETKFYKDAVKLQKVMQAKVQELLELQHEFTDTEEEDADEPQAKRMKSSKLSPRGGKYLNNIPLKRRLYSFCKCLMDYVTEDGRQPMLMFMEKPSKKLYPDYYKVIQDPIDMLTIENNIRDEKYNSEEEILKDFKLMFRNCREYNEEGSLIYKDAITLERVLMDHVRGETTEKKTPKIGAQIPSPNLMKAKKASLPATPTITKMRTLFTTIKEYKDPKGRQLSTIFNKFPSKIEYPDYYEVIKKPINLEIISQKLKGNCYESLDDLISDFVLMFDNAFKYNEPDSQIYKDALILQRVMLQTKSQLREDEDTVPDVPSAVQELLTSLFTAVYNHQDEEGRCFSDSMAELPEHDEVDGKKIRALSLDLIKRRLDSGQYRRLDLFQDDMFSCLERARRLSRTDSQVFEDSIELQSFFIRQRDELCRNGDLLNSPALNYTLLDLSTAVNSVRDVKSAEEQVDGALKEDENESVPMEPGKENAKDAAAQDTSETQEDEEEGSSNAGQPTGTQIGTLDNAMSYNQQVYRIGDFVYAEPKERGMDLMIFNIQRMWVNQENVQMMFGNQYYRPSETYHVTTRKFLEKEVFKTDQHMAIPLSSIRGRCAVINVKDYFRYKPEGFDDKDVYVCESRYSSKARLFKKIKNWPLGLTNVCRLVEREEQLEPKRNFSVFRDRVEKHKEEIAELEEQEKLVEKEKPNVETSHVTGVVMDESRTYYEQYNAPQCFIRTGDCVYLRNDSKNTSRTLICQIHKIWANKASGEAFIHGPWLVLPADVPHAPNKLFYKQEILLSCLENTNDVSQIVGKCAVLEHGEYISCRPTEIPESEVYICESMFDEARQQIVELPKDGLKKFVHSPAVFQDEIYFFRRLINPTKVNAVGEAEQAPTQTEKSQISVQTEVNFQNCSSTMVKVEPPDVNAEDSMDGGPPSVCSSDMGAPSTPNSTSNFTVSTHSSKKKRVHNDGTTIKGKQVTGYILYSSDTRKTVAANNPNRTFGEVSRIVGNEWKKLTAAEKNVWEEKAQRVNEETMAKIERGDLQGNVVNSPHIHASFIGPTLPDHIWECMWNNCDFMFEEQIDCLEHCIADGSGHVASTFAGIQTNEYQCQWKNCQRLKKNAAPFPSLHRLIRHVKEVHILKNTGRICPPSERSKHYVISRHAKPTQVHSTTINPSMASVDGASTAPSILTTTTATTTILQPNRETHSPAVQPNNIPNGVPANIVPKPVADPLFVVVPPRPNRVLHSDIYLKYIEGLSSDRPTQVGHWEKQFYATPETVPPPDTNKLPSHWLENGVGNHGNVLNALWALRDYMMKDALNLSKSI